MLAACWLLRAGCVLAACWLRAGCVLTPPCAVCPPAASSHDPRHSPRRNRQACMAHWWDGYGRATGHLPWSAAGACRWWPLQGVHQPLTPTLPPPLPGSPPTALAAPLPKHRLAPPPLHLPNHHLAPPTPPKLATAREGGRAAEGPVDAPALALHATATVGSGLGVVTAGAQPCVLQHGQPCALLALHQPPHPACAGARDHTATARSDASHAARATGARARATSRTSRPRAALQAACGHRPSGLTYQLAGCPRVGPVANLHRIESECTCMPTHAALGR